MLQRFYNVLIIGGFFWSVLCLVNTNWIAYPSDRPVALFVLSLPWLFFLVFNYLIYGRVSIILRHVGKE